MSALGYDAFTSAAKTAAPYFVRPYGIYYRGEVYWNKKLPRKKGAVVRFFEDTSTPCLSLCVFDLDGNFLCSAWPVSWNENDHPVQHEISAWMETLSDNERKELMSDE